MSTPWVPRTVAAGGHAFVIGDIHGCIHELVAILDFITPRLSSADVVVFLGDYVDRGPASKAVVERVLEFKAAFPGTVLLKGNHEQMLQDFLTDNRSIEHPYLMHGGRETFESYGAPFAQMLEDPLSAIPETHQEFYRALELGVVFGRYLFVHAGVDPSIPLQSQQEEDLLWVRERFLRENHDLPFTVVHGHTAFENVAIRRGIRIGIDTGAVFGNLLTCLELPTGVAYQVKRGETRVVVRQLPNCGAE